MANARPRAGFLVKVGNNLYSPEPAARPRSLAMAAHRARLRRTRVRARRVHSARRAAARYSRHRRGGDYRHRPRATRRHANPNAGRSCYRCGNLRRHRSRYYRHRPRAADANAYANRHAYIYPNADGYANAHADADGYANAHADRHAYIYPNANRHADAD